MAPAVLGGGPAAAVVPVAREAAPVGVARRSSR